MMYQNIADIAASVRINMKTLEVFYGTGIIQTETYFTSVNMYSRTHVKIN